MRADRGAAPLIDTASPRRGSPRAPRRAVETTLPAPVPQPTGARPRFPEFDALRGTAILLVVTLHAALAYTQVSIPRLLWGVRDPSPHPGFDLFCWWAMGVSVPLFFTMSGFFSAEIFEARGPAGFLRNRARRILAPFLVGSAILLPLSFLAWALGWLASGRCTWDEIRRMVFLDPAIMSDLYGPAHLWFLEYLIPMLAAFWTVRTLQGSRASRPGRWLLATWAPLALAVPTTLILWIGRSRNGIDATLDRHNSFLIDPTRLVHYATFFAVGLGIHRARGHLDALARRGRWYLLASLPVFALRAYLLRSDWSRPLDAGPALALAALGGLFAWLTVFGLLGLYRRHFSRPSPLVRHLADRSYWIYLIHFPIVGLIQADLFPLPIPTVLKFLIAWSLTLGLGLASYRVLVRPKSPCVNPTASLTAWHPGREATRGPGVTSVGQPGRSRL
jgi:glucan biosynthesis protein C